MAPADGVVPAELRKRFEDAGQGHVFKFLDEGKVAPDKQSAFLAQLEELDLDYVGRSFTAAMEEAEAAKAAATAGPCSDDLSPPDSIGRLAEASAEDICGWERVGIEAVGRGEVAACVLAGGQGTRLGFDGPKGCYDVGLPSNKTLFQIFAERVLRLARLGSEAGGEASRVPFLVMTSPLNRSVTEKFFEDCDRFGLPAEDVWFFEQGTMPCLTPEGKIILESAGRVASNPDGNGGFYPALQKSGCLARLQEQGIKYLHVFSVDNLLCRPADPRFVGYCIERDFDCGNKCVQKLSPEEKVGVVAKRGGRPSVVEYSELDDRRKNMRDEAGNLVFGAGNICNHLYTVSFLVDSVLPNMANMFHLARKKIPYAGEDGNAIAPTAENGVKLESFIFDVFPLSQKMAILETLREEEFAPVKNAPGAPTDSPDTARAMLGALARRWIAAAGGSVEGSVDAPVEISPLLSYSGEGLQDRVVGRTLSAPCHVEP